MAPFQGSRLEGVHCIPIVQILKELEIPGLRYRMISFRIFLNGNIRLLCKFNANISLFLKFELDSPDNV